jgi:hypothetical protein
MTTPADTIKQRDIARYVADVLGLKKGRARNDAMKSVRSALKSNKKTAANYQLVGIEHWLATYTWPVRGRGPDRQTSELGRRIKNAFAERLPRQSVNTGFLDPGPMCMGTSGMDSVLAISDEKTRQEFARLHDGLQQAEHQLQLEREKCQRAIRLLRTMRIRSKEKTDLLEFKLAKERERNDQLHRQLGKVSEK